MEIKFDDKKSLIFLQDSGAAMAALVQGDKVGGSNNAVCTRKL